MKTKQFNGELIHKTDSELKDLLLQSKKEALNLRFQKANGQVKSTAQVRNVRRSVARLKTVINQRSSVKA